MIAIAPHTAAATEHAVDGTRDADGKALHAAHESGPCIGFDEEVDMIPLHAELENAKAQRRACGERVADYDEHAVTPKGWQAGPGSQRDVGWATGLMRHPAPMRNRSPSARGLAARTVAAAAPRPNVKRELPVPVHLE